VRCGRAPVPVGGALVYQRLRRAVGASTCQSAWGRCQLVGASCQQTCPRQAHPSPVGR
jgi:hypothetical protein